MSCIIIYNHTSFKSPFSLSAVGAHTEQRTVRFLRPPALLVDEAREAEDGGADEGRDEAGAELVLRTERQL